MSGLDAPRHAETAHKFLQETLEFPDDFPERLNRFQVESRLPWAEIARRVGTYRHTVGRWKEGRGHPNTEHVMACSTWPETWA